MKQAGLGLGLRENVTTGKLVKVDYPRFDLMWEAAGATGIFLEDQVWPKRCGWRWRRSSNFKLYEWK